MSRITVVFEQDSSLDGVEVIVKAKEKNSEVEELISRLGGEQEQITVIGEDETVRVLSQSDIYLVSVNGKKLDILTESEKFSLRRTLQSVEDILDSRRFIRISRYEIINIKKVKHYDFALKGTLRIELVNGIEVWASRRCIPSIRRLLSGKGVM